MCSPEFKVNTSSEGCQPKAALRSQHTDVDRNAIESFKELDSVRDTGPITSRFLRRLDLTFRCYSPDARCCPRYIQRPM